MAKNEIYMMEMYMNEIICPQCNKAFKVDETEYANIVEQVRNTEFEKSVNQRIYQAEKESASALKLAEK